MRRMTPFLVLAFAAFGASCAEQPATKKTEKPGPSVAFVPAPPPPPVARPRISWPLSAIGRVNRQGGGFCSGILVAPEKVLTTARCLWDVRLRRWTSTADLHFLAGYHLGEFLAHRKATAFALPAGIRMTARGVPLRIANNWAILTLDRPIGAASGVRPVGLARVGGRTRVDGLGPLLRAGYGPRRPHAIESARCKAVGQYNHAVLFHDCGGGRTETGFPILVETPAGWRVLGLQMVNVDQAAARKGRGMALLVTATDQPRQTISW